MSIGEGGGWLGLLCLVTSFASHVLEEVSRIEQRGALDFSSTRGIAFGCDDEGSPYIRHCVCCNHYPSLQLHQDSAPRRRDTTECLSYAGDCSLVGIKAMSTWSPLQRGGFGQTNDAAQRGKQATSQDDQRFVIDKAARLPSRCRTKGPHQGLVGPMVELWSFALRLGDRSQA